ncbi:hypothetical protein PR048_027364 [Dryococelus australis]|uniref:Ribosomal protein L15 n=1 Tax=Dryococelus australis TaxID=614101 RepID=A0ABQ9GF89_9NEOP|nr:hypothetical protein PR048_027364 [Dryococelus australis]
MIRCTQARGPKVMEDQAVPYVQKNAGSIALKAVAHRAVVLSLAHRLQQAASVVVEEWRGNKGGGDSVWRPELTRMRAAVYRRGQHRSRTAFKHKYVIFTGRTVYTARKLHNPPPNDGQSFGKKITRLRLIKNLLHNFKRRRPFAHVGMVPDDAAGRRVFSGISRSPRPLHSGAAPYSHRFTLIGSQDLICNFWSVLHAAQHTAYSSLAVTTKQVLCRLKYRSTLGVRGHKRANKNTDKAIRRELRKMATRNIRPASPSGKLTARSLEVFEARDSVQCWDTEIGRAQPARSVYLIFSLWGEPYISLGRWRLAAILNPDVRGRLLERIIRTVVPLRLQTAATTSLHDWMIYVLHVTGVCSRIADPHNMTASECKGERKREIPEKTRLPAASSGTRHPLEKIREGLGRVIHCATSLGYTDQESGVSHQQVNALIRYLFVVINALCPIGVYNVYPCLVTKIFARVLSFSTLQPTLITYRMSNYGMEPRRRRTAFRRATPAQGRQHARQLGSPQNCNVKLSPTLTVPPRSQCQLPKLFDEVLLIETTLSRKFNFLSYTSSTADVVLLLRLNLTRQVRQVRGELLISTTAGTQVLLVSVFPLTTVLVQANMTMDTLTVLYSLLQYYDIGSLERQGRRNIEPLGGGWWWCSGDNGAALERKSGRNGISPRKPAGTIPTCENPGVTRPGIEPGSPWWEASSLTAQLPRLTTAVDQTTNEQKRCGDVIRHGNDLKQQPPQVTVYQGNIATREVTCKAHYALFRAYARSGATHLVQPEEDFLLQRRQQMIIQKMEIQQAMDKQLDIIVFIVSCINFNEVPIFDVTASYNSAPYVRKVSLPQYMPELCEDVDNTILHSSEMLTWRLRHHMPRHLTRLRPNDDTISTHAEITTHRRCHVKDPRPCKRHSPPQFFNFELKLAIPLESAKGSCMYEEDQPDDATSRRVFSGISRFPPTLHSGAAPYSHRFTLIGSQDLDVKSHIGSVTPTSPPIRARMILVPN